jgi:hypothetical protein
MQKLVETSVEGMLTTVGTPQQELQGDGRVTAERTNVLGQKG